MTRCRAYASLSALGPLLFLIARACFDLIKSQLLPSKRSLIAQKQ
jgi:hypothetical protein